MSAESLREQIAEALAGHRYRDVRGDYDYAPYYRHIGCSCGWKRNIAGMSGWRSWLAAHEAHAADAVLAVLGEVTVTEEWGVLLREGTYEHWIGSEASARMFARSYEVPLIRRTATRRVGEWEVAQ